MSTEPSSQPALRAETIQDETKAFQEERKNIQPLYSPIMNSTISSQPALKIETFQLLMLPADVLIRILKLLDMKTVISKLTVVCTSFCPFCKGCSETQSSFLFYISHIYEQHMFSRGGGIFQSIPAKYSRLLHFRPNVDLSSGEIVQPVGMRIHVFTTSDSKEIHLDKIVSMIIKSSSLDNISENTQKALQFLNNLFKNPFDSLKNMKFSGFLANRSLWEPLSTLKKLDWLHWICSVSDSFRHNFFSFSGLKRLHLEVEAGFNLGSFPNLPPSLEEFSLHLPELEHRNSIWSVCHCKSLEKM